jgi:DNA-binding transcriptional ArsR family regulator
VSELRTELEQIVELLLRESEASGRVSLDQIGDAVGARAVSYVDVDAVMSALEAAGRTVEAGAKPRGEEHLQLIIRSIRELSAQLSRRPTHQEIAERTGLSQAEVSHALQLVRIMQR